ncbi:MAG: transposon-transfer assisting family protein [Lachnospiraceae bacterium]|nr:transposon-transfer assisting family protein [Lachnospiraceae bacterium]
MKFNKEEKILMMLYSPGTRTGLKEELLRMRGELGNRERRLRSLTDSVLKKLAQITDSEFDALPLYPDLEPEEGGEDGNQI